MNELLNYLLTERDIQEVMFNPGGSLYQEKNGVIEPLTCFHLTPQKVLQELRSIILKMGKTLDYTNPILEAVLDNEVRLSAVIPPISPLGIAISLRKNQTQYYCLNKLQEDSFLQEGQFHQLKKLLLKRKNILICGATSSGKTTLLNALVQMVAKVSPHERIICLEESLEINLNSVNGVNLITRSSSHSETEEISLNTLLQKSLRFRPQRIIMGECRGEEVVALMQLLNTGHSGSMVTLHADSATEALEKLALMVSIYNKNIQYQTAMHLVKSNIQAVVLCKQNSKGHRFVKEILTLPDDE